MRKRTVRYNGATMHVRELTGRGGHAFMLVHGIGVSSRYFEPLARALHDEGDVFLLDLPGFGGIPRPDRRLSIGGFAETVHVALVQEGSSNPVLVGHSMGAQVVVELLARHPVSTHAVLIGPPVNPVEPTVVQQAARLIQSAAAESRRLRLLASRAYLSCGPAWFLDVLPAMMKHPIVDRLPLVRANTLVLRGEHDTVTPQPWIDEIVSLLPTASSAVVPGAAHNVVYEHSAPVAELVLQYLAAMDAPRSR